MSAFPPGAPSFQLPRPHLGVVYLEAGWVVVKLDKCLPVRVFEIQPAEPPMRFSPMELSGDEE